MDEYAKRDIIMFGMGIVVGIVSYAIYNLCA